nr:MAG TPA: hypothetical protein [Caudoviricetes sp.]
MPIGILPYRCTIKCVCRVLHFLRDKTPYLPLYF